MYVDMPEGEKISVGVFHHTLNSVGGGEKLTLTMIKALKKRGHKVSLFSLEKTNWNKVEKIFGEKITVDEEKYLFPFSLKAFGIYQRPLTGLLRPLSKCDVTINTHGDVMVVPTDIVYLHFPVLSIMQTETAPYLKYSKPFWKAYFKPYETLQKKFAQKMFKDSVIMTNSHYSKDWIRKTLSLDPIVVHPPVNIKDFQKYGQLHNRKNMVTSVGRFTPEKRQILMAHLAKAFPRTVFNIIGATSKASPSVIKEIVRFKEKHNLSNLHLYVNAPFEQLLEILSQTKIFFHGYVGEHFGIAVVEAMGSGCVPIVPKSGGQWTDIIENGKYGFGYDNLEEAIEIMKPLLSSDTNWQKYSKIASKRAHVFDEGIFSEKIVKIIEKIARTR